MLKWWLPILLMMVITPFTPWLDLKIEHFFFSNNQFVSNAFVDFVFSFAILPADVLVASAVIVYLCSFVIKKWKKWRTGSLYLMLTLAIGAGVIVHAVLKDHWGRPRPKQVIEFGGEQTFQPFYKPNFKNPIPSKSFPCGHCSMGFYFFALAILGKHYRLRWMQWLGWSLAITLGIILSVTRMAQGGHFLSDVLFTALIMWLTALTFEWLLLQDQFSSKSS